jgi:hypothetical protein
MISPPTNRRNTTQKLTKAPIYIAKLGYTSYFLERYVLYTKNIVIIEING